MIQVQALIQQAEILGSGYYHFELLAPAIAEQAVPGQFIEVRVAESDSLDPLLARPISIYRIDRQAGTVAFIFKAVGRGTGMLAAKQTGELLTVFGPVGNGFQVPESARNIALIAGGVGMPPMYCLAQKLVQERPGCRINLFYGGRSRSDLLELARWNALGIELFPVTEDGSYGGQGLVTTALLAKLGETPFDFLAACGPTPMLQAVQRIGLEAEIAGQVSLESYMACGVGACLGCVCKSKHGYSRVCVDGPVFDLKEVDLE